MRRLTHYAMAMIVIPFYGVQVCPFIESLPAYWVVMPIGLLLALQYLTGAIFWKTLLSSQALSKQVKSAYQLEIILFLGTGILITLFNTLVFDFPLVSGLKVIIGLLGLGFFAAIDLALETERKVAERVLRSGESVNPHDDYFPMTTKMALFASISVLLIVGIFTLLVLKDLDWLVHVGSSVSLEDGRLSILKEFLFVLAVILPHTLNIIYSYARNIKEVFATHHQLLSRVRLGDYSGQIPVSSADEFGVMAEHTNAMVDTIRNKTEELQRTRDVTIFSLATLAETRDNETGAHLLRTQRYIKVLAQHLQSHIRFSKDLTDETIDLLYKSAPLHDIGKVGIPDAILLKPGKLSDEEFEIMKTHAAIGADALDIAGNELGSNSFLSIARDISRSHHEKWDGSGYPSGLSGDSIPCAGRLMAVADVYDALISKRVYKPAFSHEKAMDIIVEGKGKHFDPDIIDALLAVEEDFRAIAAEYADTPE